MVAGSDRLVGSGSGCFSPGICEKRKSSIKSFFASIKKEPEKPAPFCIMVLYFQKATDRFPALIHSFLPPVNQAPPYRRAVRYIDSAISPAAGIRPPEIRVPLTTRTVLLPKPTGHNHSIPINCVHTAPVARRPSQSGQAGPPVPGTACAALQGTSGFPASRGIAARIGHRDRK